ncbi:hypothetical protein JYU11_00490 [bacterium AH-315-G05]|nr:hypothetical protein [bacterium AH-315-G05]
MYNTVEKDLLNIAKKIAMYYGNQIVIVGHISMLLAYGESYRHTRDVDLHANNLLLFNELETKLESIVNGCEVIDIKNHSETSKRITIRYNNNIYKIDLVLKCESWIEIEPGICIQDKSARLADKLSVVFSKKVYRRLKDLLDVLYIARREAVSTYEIEVAVNDRGYDISVWTFQYLLDTVTLKHAFIKFDGQNLYLTFEELYEEYTEFLLPMLALIQEGRIGTWDPERARWS